MADLAVTPNRLRPLEVIEARLIPMIADQAIAKGQLVYRKATGRAGLATAANKPVGVATTTVTAGMAFDALHYGQMAGFDLSAVDPGAVVYASAVAGAVGDTAADPAIAIGTVHTLTDVSFTKVIFFDIPQR